MRPDGHKVDEVVVGLTIDRELTATAALRQHRNARLIAAAPDLYEALERLKSAALSAGQHFVYNAPTKELSEAVVEASACLARARGDDA